MYNAMQCKAHITGAVKKIFEAPCKTCFEAPLFSFKEISKKWVLEPLFL